MGNRGFGIYGINFDIHFVLFIQVRTLSTQQAKEGQAGGIVIRLIFCSLRGLTLCRDDEIRSRSETFSSSTI